MALCKTSAWLAAALALMLGTATLAHAQPHGPGRLPPPPGAAHGPHYGPGHHRPPPPHHLHGHRPPPPLMQHQRGAGPDHRWVQGSRLPAHYRTRHYVVNDWQRHHLSPPPRGYHWVQYGSDYMLVAIASGVISQLILNGLR